MSGRHSHLNCEMGSHGHESQTHSIHQHEKYMGPSNEEPDDFSSSLSFTPPHQELHGI